MSDVTEAAAGRRLARERFALVLADHQPVHVTAVTQPAARVRCCCARWDGPWCDFPTHQAAALDRAGLLAVGTPPETTRVLAERADRRTT